MPGLVLRPSQEKVIDELRVVRRTHRNVLLIAPTGFGKTTCFTYIVKRAYSMGLTVHIQVHLGELLDQVAERFDDEGIPYSYIAAGYPSGDEPVKLCLVNTLVNQLDYYDPPDLRIEDEAHRVESAMWQKIREWSPNTRNIGTTATGLRLDNKPLGNSYSAMVVGPQRRELQAIGELVPVRLVYPPSKLDLSNCRRNDNGEINLQDQAMALDKADIIGDFVKEYERVAAGKQFVTFAPTLAYAAKVAKAYTEAGYPCAVISSKCTKRERRDLIKAYKNKTLRGLVNVDLITCGVDIPGIEVIQWLRHTESQVIWDQGNGRGMRPSPGKTFLYVLDHVGNCYTHATDESIMPDCDRHYSLEAVPRRKRKRAPRVVPGKRCDICHAMWDLGNKCPQCGAEQEAVERRIKTVDGQLVIFGESSSIKDQELALALAKKKKLKEGMGKCRTLRDFEALEREMEYKPGWALLQWRMRQRKFKKKTMKVG